jgi:hypothetical protein
MTYIKSQKDYSTSSTKRNTTKRLFNVFNQEKHHRITNDVLGFGQSEPAPTSAPMWMDGALMGAPFSSLPGLAKVANSS